MTTPGPILEDVGVLSNMVFIKILRLSGNISSDKKECFPVTHTRGGKYIMVMANYESDAILEEPLKSYSETFVSASQGPRPSTRTAHAGQWMLIPHELFYQEIRGYTTTGATSNTPSPDIRKVNSNIQVPPHIRTFKSQYKTPLHIWYRLIWHTGLTLNLLLPTRMNPRPHEVPFICKNIPKQVLWFQPHLLAPLWTRVIIFDGPIKQCTFTHHVAEGWYLGPAPEPYQYYTIYVPTMRAERIINTVELFPHDCPVPKLSCANAAHQAVADLMEVLRNPAPASSFSIRGDKFQAIKIMQKILEKSIPNIALTMVPEQRVPSPCPRIAPPPRLILPGPITASSPSVPSIAP